MSDERETSLAELVRRISQGEAGRGGAEILASMLEAAPDGILFLDAKSGAVFGNRAFEELLGRCIETHAGVTQEAGIIHWPDGHVVPLEEFPSLRALRSGKVVRQELVFVHADGTRIPVEEHSAPIVWAGMGVVGVVVTCRDLRPQKELERVREEFAAMVAHDLRNPIQSMLVQVRTIREGLQTGKGVTQAALDRLSNVGRRMARLTNDLLESVRIDLSRVVLDRSRRDTLQTVREVVEQVQPTVGDHPIRVGAEAPVPSVSVDGLRFQQILTNLLENAAKYSADGAPIEVSVKGTGQEVDVAVRDHGVGIAPEELPRLFDRFYQTERARKRQSGLGLGLYITKAFVEAHGGRLSVESAVNRGSTFHVILPAAA